MEEPKSPRKDIAPLAGMVVLDLTKSAAGPYCTMLLGELGADVIKIENPRGGDDIRSWGPPFWGADSTAYLALNRNKRSVALDIQQPAGQEVLWELLERADIVVQNLRPDALEKIGVGYDAVRKKNSSVIYCSMSAFGTTGPMSGAPGYDPLLQAFAGLMSVTGVPGASPVRVGTSIMDMGMGLWGVVGILGAMLRRRETGCGQLVETSLLETAISWIPYQIMGYFGTGEVPQRHGSALPLMAPYEAFPTKDGQLMVAAANNRLWRRLCAVLGVEELVDDPRFQDNPARVRNRAELAEALGLVLGTKTTSHWVDQLTRAGVPCSPIQTIDEVVSHAQTMATRILREVPHPEIPDYTEVGIPVQWDGQRPRTRLVPPALGANTREVLGWLGRTASEVDDLLAHGVLTEP